MVIFMLLLIILMLFEGKHRSWIMKPSYLKYLIFYEKNILNLTWLILVKNLNVRRKNSLILKLKLVVRLLRILKPKPMSFIKVVAINQNSLNAKKKNRKKRKKNVVETTL